MEVIGQKVLMSKLDKYTLQNFPKTILFIGESGCGKSFIANKMAARLNLPVVKLEDKESISEDKLFDYLYNPIKTMYLIDINSGDEKQQNKLLKFIEEPSDNVFIILMAESDTGILNTILNRCTKFYFEPYTKDELKKFEFMTGKQEDIVYDFCKTPGQLQSCKNENFNRLINLCNNIIDNIGNTTYSNATGVSALINYKENYNKFDFEMFFKVLLYCTEKKLEETFDDNIFYIYDQIQKSIRNRVNVSVAKEAYVINFLSNLWKGVKNEVI